AWDGRGAGSQPHRVLAIDLGQQHPDDLALRSGQVLAHVVGPDRELAMPPVVPSMPAGGTSVWPSARAGRSLRSSRYMVMSRDPAGTGRPSTCSRRSA